MITTLNSMWKRSFSTGVFPWKTPIRRFSPKVLLFRDLNRMKIVLLSQLRQGLVTPQRRKGYLRFERRGMGPSWSSHHFPPMGRSHHEGNTLTFPIP